MIYGSVCSGIEAATVAWHPLGWKPAFFSEIEAFPRAVLKHHYPEVPLHGDFTTIKPGEYEPIDLLVGGTPCQSFSVAGLRGGLDDDRGNLALEYLRLADRLRPRWLVWENVPGVLSSNGGRDFGSILGGMGELGYGVAYRVLDAQYFGVAQRRRRVFVVGHLGDWRRAAAVLFERDCLSGNPAPRREAGQAAPTIPSRSSAGGGLGTDFDSDGGLIAERAAGLDMSGLRRGEHRDERGADEDSPDLRMVRAFGGNNTAGSIDVATAVNAHGGPHGRLDFERETFVTHALRGEGFDASEDGTGRGTPIVPVVAPTLRAGGNATGGTRPYGTDVDTCDSLIPISFALRGREGGAMPEVGGDQVGALRSASGGSSRDYVAFNITPSNSNKDYNAREASYAQAVTGSSGGAPSARGGDLIVGSAVRRLTPREAERLQGFPEIENTLRILVCRSEEEKRARARSAEQGSALLGQDQSAPVAAHVLIDLERQVLQLHSLGRSPWFASIAELASSSRLPMPADAFVRLVALTNDAVANSTRAGRAASPASTRPSSAALNGSASVALYGPEIDALASDAERFTAALSQCSRSITSQRGLSDPICASTLETLACCVAHAMTGFIPAAMSGACSYELRLTCHQGYTNIPWRGKDTAPDGPRYKALGNSMAVPCMAWIGKRIAAVEALQSEQVAA